MVHTLRSTQIKSEHVAITNDDVTPVVMFGWNEAPNVSYINGVFIVWWLFIISFENTGMIVQKGVIKWNKNS